MSKLLVVISAVCYVLAFLLTTVLHEFGHAIVGSVLGVTRYCTTTTLHTWTVVAYP